MGEKTMNDEEVCLGEITIRLIIVDDESQVSVQLNDDLSCLEIVGMLEMAKDTVMRANEYEDDDE